MPPIIEQKPVLFSALTIALEDLKRNPFYTMGISWGPTSDASIAIRLSSKQGLGHSTIATLPGLQ
jgi:hypothetical protein